MSLLLTFTAETCPLCNKGKHRHERAIVGEGQGMLYRGGCCRRNRSMVQQLHAANFLGLPG